MKRSALFFLVCGGLLGFGISSLSNSTDTPPDVSEQVPAEDEPAASAMPTLDSGTTAEAPYRGAMAGDKAALLLSGAVADVAEMITPAVVTVSSTRRANREIPDWFQPFFGGPEGGGGGGSREGTGSGVIVRADGVILTNNHVIDNAEKVTVKLSDGRELTARVIGTDAKTDVAVLQVDAKRLPVVEVGNPDRLRVGELVLAVGNPFGVGQTVTMGIVSAKGRSGVGITDYEDFIQTDAAINPGNSGGALVNASGQLVGINTAIVSSSRGYQGIGFAIPVDMAMGIAGQLLADGVVRRGKLGVRIQTLERELAEAMGEPDTRGVLVSAVESGSPAQLAGLKQGDVIIAVDDMPTLTSADLRNKIAGHRPSEEVRLKVLRDNRQLRVPVVLGSLDGDAPASARPEQIPEQERDIQPTLMGLSVRDIDAQARANHELDSEDGGVLVSAVEPASPAARAGIRPGDVLLEVNRKPISGTDQFSKLTRNVDDKVLLLVSKDGESMYVALSGK